MTGEIPSWWFFVTAFAAIIIMITFVVLCTGVFKILKMIADLEPQVKSLLEKVHDLIAKVDVLATKVDRMADSAQESVSVVGHRAQGIASSLESFTSSTASKLQALAPLIGVAMAGMRLFSFYKASRGKKPPNKVRLVRESDGFALEMGDDVEEEHKSEVKSKRHRGVEQSGSSSGS